MDLLGLAARLLLGGLFVWSALPKLMAPLHFQQIILRYRVFPPRWARPLSRTLPWAEVGLAAMLLTGSFTLVAGGLSALLYLTFVCIILLAGKRNEGEDCGCFGRYSPPRRWLLAQDLLLAGVAVFAAFAPVWHFGLYQFARDPAMAHARLALTLAFATAVAASLVGYVARWRPESHDAEVISREGSAA